jgi:hypothetical protein
VPCVQRLSRLRGYAGFTLAQWMKKWAQLKMAPGSSCSPLAIIFQRSMVELVNVNPKRS